MSAVVADPARGVDTIKGRYAGRTVALLTRHGKEQVVGPVLEAALGCNLQHVDGFDTDQLGTFTREIAREGSQLNAARRKARIGMELSGQKIGLASEGSFGVDPTFGLLHWNVELLVWIDDELGIEVVGRAQEKACFGSRRVASWADAEVFAKQFRFPSHHVVVRPSHRGDTRVEKDIRDWAELRAAWERALALSDDGLVLLETDGRSHANPTRQGVIARAATDLARRLGCACPACDAPGFDTLAREAGLPCSDCGSPTGETRADIAACVRCDHRVRRTRPLMQADPAYCGHCNP